METLKELFSKISPIPNNFIVEQNILNILLTNPTLIKSTILNLKSNAFYNESHKLIYEMLIELSENQKIINYTILITKLEEKGILKKIGGIHKVISIINKFENFSFLEEYIEIINKNYYRRLIIELGKNIINWGINTSINLDEIFLKIEEAILKLNQQKIIKKIYTAAEIVDDIFEEMNSKNQKKEKFGYQTCFKDLDSILQGFQKSDLIIVSGRPSMGKTAFSLNLAKNIVENYNIPLIIFSLEMSRQQIIYRFISSDSNVNNNRLKSGRMTSEEWKKLSQSLKKISEMPIFIDDNPNLNLNDIRIKLKKLFIEKNQTGLVIIDYLQLMKSNFKLENRVQEISYLTRNLKLLAKEFNIPIILLSQLSRNVESRVNKRPMLSDLRESGCLVQSKKINNNENKSWNSMQMVSYLKIPFQLKGIKPTYLITLKNKIKIQLTSNHKILGKSGWLRISEITNKSEIFCAIKGKKNLLTTEKKFFYEKVLNLEYKGIHTVYDKTIPNFHNYLVETVILHNSIEQDADIVIMLYREDYYNEKQLLPQITEFIVAKHRNGPVGTAKLLFNPSITTFQNLK